MRSTPQRVTRRFFGPVPTRFRARTFRSFRADEPFTRCLDRLAEWSFRNPVGVTGGNPKHTRAERFES